MSGHMLRITPPGEPTDIDTSDEYHIYWTRRYMGYLLLLDPRVPVKSALVDGDLDGGKFAQRIGAHATRLGVRRQDLLIVANLCRTPTPPEPLTCDICKRSGLPPYINECHPEKKGIWEFENVCFECPKLLRNWTGGFGVRRRNELTNEFEPVVALTEEDLIGLMPSNEATRNAFHLINRLRKKHNAANTAKRSKRIEKNRQEGTQLKRGHRKLRRLPLLSAAKMSELGVGIYAA